MFPGQEARGLSSMITYPCPGKKQEGKKDLFSQRTAISPANNPVPGSLMINQSHFLIIKECKHRDQKEALHWKSTGLWIQTNLDLVCPWTSHLTNSPERTPYFVPGTLLGILYPIAQAWRGFYCSHSVTDEGNGTQGRKPWEWEGSVDEMTKLIHGGEKRLLLQAHC